MSAPQEAVDYLRSNPQLWREFRTKYGTLPDDFAPPKAPAEAEDFLAANPDLAPDFQEKYGYTPSAGLGANLKRVFGFGSDAEQQQAEREYDAERGVAGAVKNVGNLTRRSVARLGEGLTELPSVIADIPGRAVGAAVDTVAGERETGEEFSDAEQSAIRAEITRQNAVDPGAPIKPRPVSADPSTAADVGGALTRSIAAPVTESKPVLNAREWTKAKQKEAVDALTPAARRALELALVESEEDGGLKLGEGATDPWWWTANVIDVGVQAAPGLGTGGVAARLGYAAKYRQVLGELSVQKIPQSLAIKEAEKQAMKAAGRSAMIAGGLTEGSIAGGQDAAQTRATIESLDEQTLMGYPGYVELRDSGLSHEEAREKIAGDKAASVAIAAGAVVGLTGAPMNAFFGRLTAKLGREAAGTAGRLATAGRAALGEGAQEFVQEGGEQVVQNTAEQPITGKGTWEGVLENSITGFTLGGVVGGGAGLVLHGGKKGKATEADPTEPGGADQTTLEDGPLSGPSALDEAATAYDRATQALERGEANARDPNVKMDYAALTELREARKQAIVNYTRELLHAGKISAKNQAAVAEAMRQAEAEGITAQTRKAAAAGDVSPERDAALQAVADAQELEETAANDLISNGLAKVNPRGVVVLTPEGRRARKAAQDRVEAEKAESSPAATKPAESKAAVAPEAQKPKNGTAAKPKNREKLRLPADRREVAQQREAQRAERAVKPRKQLVAEKAAIAAKEQDRLAAKIEATEQDIDNADRAERAVGKEPDGMRVMRDAFERARRGLPIPKVSTIDPKTGTSRGAMRLKGAPKAVDIPGKGKVAVEPVKAAKEAAVAYRKARGITAPEQTEFARVDPKNATRIAKAFEEMKHEPNNPRVKRAYRAMVDETKAQWDEIKKTGLKVEFIKPGQTDPYAASPRMAIEDVRDNNHLWVFPTDSGFGTDSNYSKDNPMLEDTGETVDGHKLKANDVFRIVHDYFGHVQEANGFRADGEENAWRIHASMYSPLARRAMTTETRGQNSWVNYGPYGEKNRTASSGETKYADQKIGLLPAEFSSFPGETLKFKHFSSATDDRLDLDPDLMGTGAKGAEAKRNGPKVVALYGEHGETEPDVANGKTRYDVEIPKEDLYDATADSAGLLAAAQVPYGMTTDAQGNVVPVGTRFDMNKFEELVRDAGYLGYHTPGAQGILKGQARIFEKYPATRAGATAQPDKINAAARMKRKTSEEAVRGLLTAEENARLKKASVKKLIEVFDELPSGAELAASAVAGQAKRGWYRRSSEALVNVFGPDAPRFAALLAALSPQTSVEWNFRNATAMWVAWDKAGRPTDRKKINFLLRDNLFPSTNRVGTAGVLPAWINNTVRALSTPDPSTVVLSGPKVDSFAANLRGETDRVTLDAWMANWAGVNQALFKGEMNVDGTNPGMRPGYLAFAARVREAAKILSDRTGEAWTPAEVQETVWSWAKTLYEQAESFGALATARELVDNQELSDELINATPDFAGLFADPEISASLSGTVYGERAARSAGETAAGSGVAGKAAPAAEDTRHLRKAADRLDALRQARAEPAARRAEAPPAKGIARAELQAVSERVADELGIDANIAETQNDLPDYVRAGIPEGVTDVAGYFYDHPVTGPEIWYVRENLDSAAEAYETALHEAVGHMGLRAILGDQYHKVMESIRASFPAQVVAAAKRNGISLTHPDFATARRLQSLATEEMIAYAAGRMLQRRGALSKQGVWAKIIAKVRDILRSVGLVKDWNVKDIEDLIYQARDHFRKPADLRARELRYAGDIAMAAKKGKAGPIWHSPVEQFVELAPQNIATGRQWLGMIKNAKGVKAEELEWLGLEDWLVGPSGDPAAQLPVGDKVTRQQLLDYVRAHKTQVQEVAKGVSRKIASHLELNDARTKFIAHLHDMGIMGNTQPFYDYIEAADEGTWASYPGKREALSPEAQRAADAVTAARQEYIAAPDSEVTKYAQYQTPGGSNYKELLLTLPAEKFAEDDPYHPLPQTRENTYKSGHWSEPNVLVHIRFNERTVAGKKVLFLEEVQSDWHQTGRKRGYITPETIDAEKESAAAIKEYNDFVRDLRTAATAQFVKNLRDAEGSGTPMTFDVVAAAQRMAEGMPIDQLAKVVGRTEDYGRVDARINRTYASNQSVLVPNAPFKTSWPELAIKRMLRYAAENGFDTLAWTNGAMQADRYDLSQQVNAIVVAPRRNGDRAIQVDVRTGSDFTFLVNKEGTVVHVNGPGDFTDKKIDEVIGKEMGEKVMAAERLTTFSGLDLQVGGEGMKGFYDKLLPKTVDKYVKKWGAKVEPLLLETKRYVIEGYSGHWQIGDLDNFGASVPQIFPSRSQAQAWVDMQPRSGDQVHSVPINSDMRDSVMQSQPMFAFKQAPTGNPDLDAFIDKIGVRPKSLKQRWDEFKHDAAEKAAMGMFDELYGIRAAETIAGVPEQQQGYISARLSRAAPEVVSSIIEHGPPVWNDGAPDIGQGVGLLAILKPLGNNVNLWLVWMAGNRANRLWNEGRERLFTRREIDAAMALGPQHPEFEVARRAYNQLQKQVLDFAEEAGVIDPQGRALWEHSDYIPFHRIMQGGEITIPSKAGGGIGFIRNQIKQLKGGRQNIGDPLENIVRNWQSLMDASLQAVAGRMTVDNLNGSGLVTPHKFVANAAPIQNLNALLQANPNLANALTNAGINVATMPPAAMAGLQKMLNIAPPAGEDVVSVWRGGKKEFWHVHDPNLFRSLKNINPKLWGPWMKLFSYPKRVVTKTITMTPQFMVKNFWRDMWHTFVIGAKADNTRINMLPTDSLRGLASALSNSAEYRSMVAGGGGFGESFIESGDPTSMAGSVRRSINKSKTRSVVLGTPIAVWRFYRSLQNAAENANRVSLYRKGMQAGLGRRMSLYQARDTMDFSMRGNAEIVRLIAGMVPFWNARLQGMYRLARGGKSAFASVALRGLLLSAASLALLARNHDDERYKALTDQQKASYWHFWVNDVHYQLPKPFEVGTIFGTVPEAIGDAMLTNSDQPDAVLQSAKLVGYAFGETLNMAPQPATVWPLVELAINKDTFTGSPILTQGDESVLPEDQRGPRTSNTYAQLARLVPDDAPEALRSPKQLEHLGRGYIGNVQDYVLLATDALVRRARGEAPSPERATQDIPGLRDFYSKGPARTTRYSNTMFELADQAAKVEASITKAEKAETDEGDARVEELEAEYPQLLDVGDDFQGAVKSVIDLKKEQRAIQLDEAMTPAQKREEIDAIQTDINDIAKDVYDLRPGGKLNPDQAGKLLLAPPTARVKLLKQFELPATAALLESLA